MIPQKTLIIGTGAQAKYTLEILYLKKMPVVGIIALPGETPPEKIDGVSVIGSMDQFADIYSKNGKPSLILCCSKNNIKEKMAKDLADLKVTLDSFIDEYSSILANS